MDLEKRKKNENQRKNGSLYFPKGRPKNKHSLLKMGSQAAAAAASSSFSLSTLSCNTRLASSSSHLPFLLPLKPVNSLHPHIPSLSSAKSFKSRTQATLDEKEKNPSFVQQQQPNQEVDKSVQVLKNAAKTRKVPAEDILSAFTAIEKAKIDPSCFLETLGGSDSPGRNWMLVFTAKKKMEGGSYVPITAVQRFDAAAMRIENGVYLGPIGFLTFEGRFSWKNRILSFIFERIRVKIGPFNPLEIGLGQKEDREPNTKDPFFIWFYIDEEIAVARGKSGGTAFWCRCARITT